MLAIVIPYYKLTFFDATLHSLANQTDEHFKVYIGDDASPEDPAVLLEKYKGKFEFTYHRFVENLGSTSLTKQWDRCIGLSKDEEWLMILGDDDVLGVNVVEEFCNFIKDKEELPDLIRFNLKVIDDYGNLKCHGFLNNTHDSELDLLSNILLLKGTITASEFIFNRKVYNLNNGFVEFPLAWFSDYATWLVFSKNKGIYQISNAVVFWRLSNINISSKSLCINKIELKVKSLFLFMVFLQEKYKIEIRKQKQFTHAHLFNLLNHVTFYQMIKIIGKQLFSSKFSLAKIIIIEFIIKKINLKIRKIYGSIYSASKG